jgi:hypothetical protein
MFLIFLTLTLFYFFKSPPKLNSIGSKPKIYVSVGCSTDFFDFKNSPQIEEYTVSPDVKKENL